MAILARGTQAPEFTLPSTIGGDFTLSAHRDRNVVLAFYPGDWTPVCTSQLGIYNEMGDMWDELDALVVGISVDSLASHQAFAEQSGLRIPLLSDCEPKGDVARRYGAYLEDQGTAARALFVVGRDGRIAWSELSPLDANPGAAGIIAALERAAQERRGREAAHA